MNINHVNEIFQDSFGLWISGFFSAIGGWNPSFTFKNHKNAFFFLLEKLLLEKKIKFSPPNELKPRNDEIWNADDESILEYFRLHWPDDARNENDTSLTNYFYEMPAILWVDDDGKLHSS